VQHTHGIGDFWADHDRVGLASGRYAPFSQANRTPTTQEKHRAFPRCYGPQFIARDFKEFIRISGMTHVRTSPYYPQSNGKIERWHKSLKSECIRPGTPLSLEDARHLVEGYVEHYNNARLNSAIGYITPKDVLAGRQQEIHAERDRKLEAARQQRQSHASKPREERSGQTPRRPTAGAMDSFRFADDIDRCANSADCSAISRNRSRLSSPAPGGPGWWPAASGRRC
ncbi:MAG TPA: integrase core domain-containing protein, partial [Candidatus Sulfotelmatobacter sp.]|nr:integrase core domain-containing protein [Candidatus Sulfotelmatobacter sp.]